MRIVPRDRYTVSLAPSHRAACRVRDGARITAQCPSAFGGVIDAEGRADKPVTPGNPMSGPIAVKGLHAGDTLAVRIESIAPVGYGRAQDVVYRQGGPNGRRLEFLGGVRAVLDPSIGCLGVAPRRETDATFNDTCGSHGGNMDCRDWAPGATAFFRVQRDGANLGVGDVHWAMGGGEVGGQGIEGAADVTLRLKRAPGAAAGGAEWPWLVRDGWLMTLAGHPDFKTAQRIAYEEMMTLTRNLFHLERSEVQARISCAGHLRVCQACCPVITLRMCLPLEVLGTNSRAFLRRMLTSPGRSPAPPRCRPA